MTQGYLRFFEPDVFVEATPGLAVRAGIQASREGVSAPRVVGLSDFVHGEGSRSSGFAFGLNIFDLYSDLYDREFQYLSKIERRIARVAGRGRDAPFIESTLGAFPDTRELSYIQRGFHHFFSPEAIQINAAAWRRIIEDGFRTPLDLTGHGIKHSYMSLRNPTLFVFDPLSTTDLIEMWNLRQFQQAVLPVNVWWVDELRAFLRSLVEQGYCPLPDNPHEARVHTTVEFAGSIDTARRASLAELIFGGLPQGSWSRKSWYEPLWQERTDDGVSKPRRAHLTAKEIDLQLTLSEGPEPWLSFRTLSPDFASRSGGRYSRWVNVLTFRQPPVSHDRALVLPGDFPKLGRLRASGELLATREGLVLPLQLKGIPELIQIPSGSEVISAWFKAQGISAEKSDPGRIADQVLAAVNGFWGSFILENAAIIELLNWMTKSIRRETDGAVAEYPDRTASASEWTALLKRRQSKDRFPKICLDDFVRAGALKLGLLLKCKICQGKNWYGLDQLSERLQCARCLNEFSFPQGTLSFANTPWHYRVAGPFSAPDFAAGAYATVLALRTFARKLGVGCVSITFSTNLVLKKEEWKQDSEVDFALWFERDRSLGEGETLPLLVLGEAKSFAEEAIRERDVARMKRLAHLIPGAFLAFAVLKDALSEREGQLLRKLAVWGRGPLPGGGQRAPVIVLTGRELFAEGRVSEAWLKAGGKAAALIPPGHVLTDNLWTLADLTQQLYLDLDPFDVWLRGQKTR